MCACLFNNLMREVVVTFVLSKFWEEIFNKRGIYSKSAFYLHGYIFVFKTNFSLLVTNCIKWFKYYPSYNTSEKKTRIHRRTGEKFNAMTLLSNSENIHWECYLKIKYHQFYFINEINTKQNIDIRNQSLSAVGTKKSIHFF